MLQQCSSAQYAYKCQLLFVLHVMSSVEVYPIMHMFVGGEEGGRGREGREGGGERGNEPIDTRKIREEGPKGYLFAKYAQYVLLCVQSATLTRQMSCGSCIM